MKISPYCDSCSAEGSTPCITNSETDFRDELVGYGAPVLREGDRLFTDAGDPFHHDSWDRSRWPPFETQLNGSEPPEGIVQDAPCSQLLNEAAHIAMGELWPGCGTEFFTMDSLSEMPQELESWFDDVPVIK